LKQSSELSERIYSEVVDKDVNTKYAGGRADAIYENVITNHGNIIATFKSTRELKTMLGEISDGLAEDREDEQRRRLQENICVFEEVPDLGGCTCVVTIDGFQAPGKCDKPSCENPTKLCDGSNNFPYIAFLRQGESSSCYPDACEQTFLMEILIVSLFSIHLSWL